MKMNKTEKKVIIIMVIAAIVAVMIYGLVWYINDYYHATDRAETALLGNDNVAVTEEDECYYFRQRKDENRSKEGIIFYPGGKVEETAYAPLLLELAEEGYDVYLVKMPAKLAMFGTNKASAIIEQGADITEWTMMGHSLGGAIAANYCAENDEEIENLVLLAAYSMVDLKELALDVYSFYGTEDGVLNMDNYEKYYSNLPEDMTETVIEGGNHSYYAHYGEQAGDGTATITRDEQQEMVLDVFLSLEKAAS